MSTTTNSLLGLSALQPVTSAGDLATKPNIKVVVAQAGADTRAVTCPEGTTVKEVLEKLGISTANQLLTVGRNAVTLDHVLTDKNIMIVAPKPKNS